MSSQQFTQAQKLTILKSAASVGIKAAAKIAGVHYTTVYDWHNKPAHLGEAGFLTCQPSWPGCGVKTLSAGKQAAVLDCWKSNLGFGPGQVRGENLQWEQRS